MHQTTGWVRAGLMLGELLGPSREKCLGRGIGVLNLSVLAIGEEKNYRSPNPARIKRSGRLGSTRNHENNCTELIDPKIRARVNIFQCGACGRGPESMGNIQEEKKLLSTTDAGWELGFSS